MICFCCFHLNFRVIWESNCINSFFRSLIQCPFTPPILSVSAFSPFFRKRRRLYSAPFRRHFSAIRRHLAPFGINFCHIQRHLPRYFSTTWRYVPEGRLDDRYKTVLMLIFPAPFSATNRLQESGAIWRHLAPFLYGAHFVIIIGIGVFSLHFLTLWLIVNIAFLGFCCMSCFKQ